METTKQVKILGIKVSQSNRGEVLDQIREYLSGHGAHQISTVNPEFILVAQKDERLFNILNQVDLAIPDGIGLKFAAWLHGRNVVRYAGSDLMQEILSMAESGSHRVGIINWTKGLSENYEIEKVLSTHYPKLNFRIIALERGDEQLPEELLNFSPHILFCALGSPWQEFLLNKVKQELSDLKLGMGIGGAFDFLTGKTRRAPRIVRSFGFEWVWRLFYKPMVKNKPVYGRARRIYNAFIIFSWKAFLDRLGLIKRNF